MKSNNNDFCGEEREDKRGGTGMLDLKVRDHSFPSSHFYISENFPAI